jgi:hypothetical protein
MWPEIAAAEVVLPKTNPVLALDPPVALEVFTVTPVET